MGGRSLIQGSWHCRALWDGGILAEVACRLLMYSHPEVGRIWSMSGIYHGSFKDHILSTPGWLYLFGGKAAGVAV